MPYNYSSLIAALQTEAVIQATDPNWLAIIPTIIDQSEQKIYRDLDLLSCTVRDTTGSLTANSRTFTLPQALGRFVTVQEMSYFTGMYPTGRTLLLPLPRSIIESLYPSETGVSNINPQYYTPVTDQIFLIAPAPYSAFPMEITGTIRPTPLSATNTTTFLSNYCSDLLFAACMVAIAGYTQNFGSQADNPKLALSWDQEYQTRLASLKLEEMKRKYSFGDWVSQ